MKGITIALISCVFFGLQPVFSKVLLNHMPPVVLAALTSFSAAFLLVFILEVEHKIREVEDLGRREVLVLLVISLLSGVLAQILYVTGLMQSTATNAVLLTRLNSLLIALLGVVFLKEKLTAHQIAGSVLMAAGVVIIATKSFTVSIRWEDGDILLILAAFCWASANIIMKKYICNLPPEVIVIGRHAFAGIILVALTAGQIPAVVNLTVLAYLTGLVILVIVIGQYLWYYALEHTSAANVGLASLSLPFFGVLYAVTLLGEELTPHQILGGTMIILGLIAVEVHLSTLRDIECRIRGIHMPHH
jgi:drug/metabolite transporter (DMT)-like permease